VTRAATPDRPLSRTGRAAGLARAASLLVAGAFADIGEMLVYSLIGAGVAAAAATALAGLLLWSLRAARRVLRRGWRAAHLGADGEPLAHVEAGPSPT